MKQPGIRRADNGTGGPTLIHSAHLHCSSASCALKSPSSRRSFSSRSAVVICVDARSASWILQGARVRRSDPPHPVVRGRPPLPSPNSYDAIHFIYSLFRESVPIQRQLMRELLEVRRTLVRRHHLLREPVGRLGLLPGLQEAR